MSAVDLWVDMTIHQKQICPSVVIDIGEDISPSNVRPGASSNSACVRNIGERPIAFIAPQSAVILAEVADKDGLPSSMVVVVNGNTHIRLFIAISAKGSARVRGNLAERAVTVVAIQIVRPTIVGNEKIDVAVIVEVRPY